METMLWSMPTRLKAYPQLKELHPVFGHKLNVVWTTDLGPKVCQLLGFQGVLWTSIAVVRFIKVGAGEAVSPIVLWIGVAPESLLSEDAHTSGNAYLDLLEQFGITDVEVKFRESIYILLAGPNLLKPTSDLDLDADVHAPLTPALGLSIAAHTTPHIEGTGGIYLAEGGDSKKVLLVTACHVLIPPNDGPNLNYTRTNTGSPRRNILLLGTKVFNSFLDSTKIRIRRHGTMVERCERQIEQLQARVAFKNKEDIKKATTNPRRGRVARASTSWAHIVRSPPITLGAALKGLPKIMPLSSSTAPRSRTPLRAM